METPYIDRLTTSSWICWDTIMIPRSSPFFFLCFCKCKCSLMMSADCHPLQHFAMETDGFSLAIPSHTSHAAPSWKLTEDQLSIGRPMHPHRACKGRTRTGDFGRPTVGVADSHISWARVYSYGVDIVHLWLTSHISWQSDDCSSPVNKRLQSWWTTLTPNNIDPNEHQSK